MAHLGTATETKFAFTNRPVAEKKKRKGDYLWETPSVSDHKNTLDAQAKIFFFHEIYFKYTMHSFLFNNFKRQAQTNLDNARNKSVIVAQDKTVGQIKPNT